MAHSRRFDARDHGAALILDDVPAGSVLEERRPFAPRSAAHAPVLIAFTRFGPYHWARVGAAAALADVVALELDPRDRTYAWEAAEPAQGVRRIVLDPARTSRRSEDVRRRARAVVAGEQPSVIGLAGYADPGMLALLAAARARGLPVVLMSESTAADEPRVAWREAVKRRIVRLFDAALVGGRPQADYVAELGMPREHIFLGYDVVDTAHFATPAPRPPELAGRSARPFFLASARFVAKKNLPRLLDAYARYRALAGASAWSLVLLGDGELRSALEAKAGALGLGGSVSMPGFKQYPELPGWYQAASCFLHASTSEQWGLVVNEAMAAGLPVLVSNRCGCAADLVQEGVNGFTFDPVDTEQLARLMHRIAHEGVDRAAMGKASREIIADWGPERFASGLKQAVDCSMATTRRRVAIADRALLWALIHR